jgi:cellulose biosynthesis protein BcsQ
MHPSQQPQPARPTPPGTTRFALLGLAHARSAWFAELSRWATAGTLPVDFVKCVSPTEIQAHLATGRVWSALVVDSGLVGLDRELFSQAAAVGCAVLVVDDGRVPRDWPSLGAAGSLRPTFSSDDLRTALAHLARPIARLDAPVRIGPTADLEPGWRGRLLAVCGSPGSGTSTTAMAVAQGLAADARMRRSVLLADLQRRGELAMLHDARDVAIGLLELSDAYRLGDPPLDAIGAFVLDVPARGYHLLPGLHRGRDWTAVRPRAFDAALDALRRSYRCVIADVDDDLEGDERSGSLDVGDRNHLARAATSRADLVLAVGKASLVGMHRLVRTVDELVAHGVDPERILPTITSVPRSPRARAELTQALADLTAHGRTSGRLAVPLLLPDTPRVEASLRDGRPLPEALTRPAALAVSTLLASLSVSVAGSVSRASAATAIRAGSLGHWHEQESA